MIKSLLVFTTRTDIFRTVKRLNMLLEVSEAVEKERDYGLGRDYRNPSWDELFRRLDSFDLLRSVANDAPEIKSLYQKHISLITRSLATQLLDDGHYRNIHQQFSELLIDIHEGNLLKR